MKKKITFKNFLARTRMRDANSKILFKKLLNYCARRPHNFCVSTDQITRLNECKIFPLFFIYLTVDRVRIGQKILVRHWH